jgi:hypothetical protein
MGDLLISAGTSRKGELKMDDEELRRLLKRTDREFSALYRRMAKFRESKSDFIFTKAEKKAWSKAEPDFPKPIVKPTPIVP